jgi:hypothetical protein
MRISKLPETIDMNQFTNALDFAQKNNVNYRTVVNRCKSGKYLAIRLSGSRKGRWWILKDQEGYKIG